MGGNSLRLALFAAVVLSVLCPAQGSGLQHSKHKADPCSSLSRTEVKKRKAHLEKQIRKGLKNGTLHHIQMDPCAGTVHLKTTIEGCDITARNGHVSNSCHGASAAAGAHKGFAAKGPSVRGQATMFGGPADKSTNGWSNRTANGESTRTPGVAVNVDGNALSSGNRSRLGGYWLMHMPDGDWVYRQTDLGPSGWTGHKIDFSAGSLPAHGISVSTPMSWNNISGTYLGKNASYAQYNGKCVSNCRRQRLTAFQWNGLGNKKVL